MLAIAGARVQVAARIEFVCGIARDALQHRVFEHRAVEARGQVGKRQRYRASAAKAEACAGAAAIVIEHDLRARFDDCKIAVAAAHFGERGAAAAAGPHGPVNFLETLVRRERGRQRADEEFRGPQAARSARRANLHARVQHLCDERQFSGRVGVREAAADGAAVARLHVADPRERFA